MSSPSEALKTNASPKDKSVLEVDQATKMKSTLDQQQSVLRKSPVSSQESRKLIKILPKTAIPLKTLHGPNGNIIVHGPHNKLVSLQVKTGIKSQTSAISLLPITIPKDAKPTNKIPALTLIGSRPKGVGKEVLITKAMISQNISKSLLSVKSKNVASNMVSSTNCNLQKVNNKEKELSVPSTTHISLLPAKSKDVSNGPPQSPIAPIIKPKDTLSSNSTILTSLGKNPNSILLPAKPKDTTPKTDSIPTVKVLDNVSKAKQNSNFDIETSITSITAINSKTPILCTKNLKEISISKTTPSTGTEAKAKDATVYKPVTVQNQLGTIVKAKGLEIKAVSITSASNVLSPAQAATVLSKNVPIRRENIDITPTITVDKMKSLSATLTKTLIQTAINSSLLNRATPHPPVTKPTAEVSILKKVTTHNTQEKADKAERDEKTEKMEKVEKAERDEKAEKSKGAEKVEIAEKSKGAEKGEISEKAEKAAEHNEKQSAVEPGLESKTAEAGHIRVRSIETLTQCNSKIKPKQQSLLKNKTIEKLKRSPRTKGRSKSLTAVLSKSKQQKSLKSNRRLSSASDTKLKKLSKPTLGESLLKALRDGESPKSDNSLLCHEQLEISPTNSTLKNSTDSLSSELKEPLTDPIKTEPPNTISDPEAILPDTPIVEDLKLPKSKQLDACSLLSWTNGIGLSKDCKYNFQLNEFGLLEINEDADSKARTDSTYDKPIYEREFKSQNTADYSDPLYFCKGCNCHGAAVDFLVPDFCSHECIQRYSSKNLPKKYENRKKDVPKLKKSSRLTDKNSFPPFNWTFYLKACKGEPAPIDLFPNPFPCGPNLFKTGMKLEAIDPEHSNLFCVCTIIDKKGYRLKLHFDGYSKKHDFWINADSMDIFPPGWCSKTNRMLQPPKSMSQLSFNWPMYLSRTRSISSPRNLFTHLNSSSNTNPFEVGMKLEADDLRNTRKVCVASVTDVLDNRILIHFDGWDESYDYWIDINSPYIHPVNWHEKNGFSIVSPPDWEDHFDWKSYLSFTRCTPATEELFSTREPISFRPGMKLEVVDKKSPSLIRPATVIMADEYEIKVLFDGWPEKYAFWVVDDSPDIHPVGWCEATGHDLESPPGFQTLIVKIPCPILGCRGIGNAKRPELDCHATVDHCPYEFSNWNIEVDKSQRLDEAIGIPPEEDFLMLTKRKFEEDNDLMPSKSIKLDLDDNSMDKKKNTSTRINVSHQLLCDYGPRLQFIHNLWLRNSECLTKHITEPIVNNPLNWSVDDVTEYIKRLPRCQAISEEFKRQEIDGSALLSIRQNDLTDIMNIKLGPAIKIYNQIVQLREEVVTNFSTFLSLPSC